MQNFVAFLDPPDVSCDISLKAANMCFNRFYVDEAATFELSGIYHFNQASWTRKDYVLVSRLKAKGKGYSFGPMR